MKSAGEEINRQLESASNIIEREPIFGGHQSGERIVASFLRKPKPGDDDTSWSIDTRTLGCSNGRVFTDSAGNISYFYTIYRTGGRYFTTISSTSLKYAQEFERQELNGTRK